MTVDFADYFWGEKNNGFDVLYHNMKHGVAASKELADFFRERSAMEENNFKLLSKVAKQASNSNITLGTFTPVWTALRGTAEKLASLHLQLSQKVAELIKDVSRYSEELHKKHKVVKDEESSTLEVVQSIQSITATLQKAKDICLQRRLEVEKLRKDNASHRELEKSEIKFKKAQDDYKILVDKYTIIRNDFEMKMTQACRKFQEVEESHLGCMKDFLSSYADVLQKNHEKIGQIHIDFKRQCLDMSVDKLLEQFVQSRYTGFEKPGLINYDKILTNVADRTLSPVQDKVNEAPKEASKGANGETGVAGFLRSRREKRKEKKANKKKKDPVETNSNKEEKSDVEDKDDSRKSDTPTPEVDEDGYCIRPKTDAWENEKGFYSSSDSDSDDERDRKIHIEIKPLSNGSGPISASVDELRATVENLSLSPAPVMKRDSSTDSDQHLKRSQSVSQPLYVKPSSDLLGLNLFNPSSTPSSASTPTTNHPYAPLQSPPTTSPIGIQHFSLSAPSSSHKFPEGDLFSEMEDITPALPLKYSTTTVGSIAIPRPPSRRGEVMISRGRVSPASITRADSVASLEFRTAVGVASSRGPSPLTIGMADTIPIAVAFHEIIHSFFRGSDELRTQVKLCGDMMLSFPAGIVAVLTKNPSPAKLQFKLRNSNRFEKMVPNSQLIAVNTAQGSFDSTFFEFNMSALTSLLRRQAEQNPAASYFNVDILKYQIKGKGGASSCPFQLVAYWKCESSHTDLKVDYKYNRNAMASPTPLLNVQVSVPIDGGFKTVNSKPNAHWLPDTNRLLWKLTEVSQYTEGAGVGSLKARVELSKGPGTQGTIQTQFNCEGTTLSGVEFDLTSPGYRVSLIKRRFVSGKYICDGDGDQRMRYVSPTTTVS